MYQYYNESYVISYSNEKKIVRISWRGKINGLLRKKGLDHCINLMRTVKAKCIISDEIDITHDWFEHLDQLETEWHHSLNKMAVKHLIIVASDKDFIYTNFLKNASLKGLEIMHFHSLEIAEIYAHLRK